MTDPTSTAPTPPDSPSASPAPAYEAAVDGPAPRTWVNRLFARDTTLWSSDERVQDAILDRLGWLDAPAHFTEHTAGLEGFGDAVVDEGYTTSSWPGWAAAASRPDVLHRTFGSQDGYPALRILDSTDPAFVVGDARRPRPAPDPDGRREQVRHDDRAERLPRGRPGRGPRPPSTRSATTPTRARARSSPRSPIPARASTRSPTTTTSARSSSTRPTSAGGTRR